MFLMNLAIGFAIGTGSVLSRLVGGGNNEKVKQISTLTIVLGFSSSIILTLIGIFNIDSLFTLLGADKEQLIFINEYMVYAYMGMGFRMASISVSGTFRAHGITKVPSYSIIMATILNTILDPIFIFGFGDFPALGIEGAGLATLLANGLAFLYEFYIASIKFEFFAKINELTKEAFQYIQDIVRIAIPASISNALNPLSLSYANFLLSEKNTDFVAGFGVATKVQFFTMIPILALSAAISSVVGQNYGKENYLRVKETIKISLIFSCAYAVIQIFVLSVFAHELVSLFDIKTEKALDYSIDYIFYISFTLWGYFFVIVINSLSNAINKPLKALLLISLRTFILFVPAYYIFEFYDFHRPVIFGIAISNILSGVYSYILYNSHKENILKN